MTDKHTLIFLGPSLNVDEARAIYPEGHFLSPVKCGDIFQAMRLKPKRIAIIDGIFEQTAAVWHKEILFALEKGVQVIGASSMGALRAAELSDFKMQGVGEVFQLFHTNELVDDDEVAVLHMPAQSQHEPISDAMVSVRATLKAALQKAIIAEDFSQSLELSIKAQHYRERNLKQALENLKTKESEALLAWLEQDNYVDLKKRDAIGLLEYCRDNTPQTPKEPITAHRSLSIRRLNLQMMTKPLDFPTEDLPVVEQLAQRWEKGGLQDYWHRLAHYLALFDGLVETLDLKHKVGYEKGVFFTDFSHEWLMQNDCSEEDANYLAKRMHQYNYLLNHMDEYIMHPQDNWEYYYLANLKLNGDYVAFKNDYTLDIVSFAKAEPLKHRVVELIAHFAWFFQNYMHHLDLYPRQDRLQKHVDKYRRENDLIQVEPTQAWLKDNDLDVPALQKLMMISANYNFTIKEYFFEHLGFFEVNEERVWLLDALRITGGYRFLKP